MVQSEEPDFLRSDSEASNKLPVFKSDEIDG